MQYTYFHSCLVRDIRVYERSYIYQLLVHLYNGKEPVDDVENYEKRWDENEAYPVCLFETPDRNWDLEAEKLLPGERVVHVEDGAV